MQELRNQYNIKHKFQKDLPDKESVSKILDSKYELPTKKQLMNLKNSKSYKQLKTGDQQSEVSLQSASHFYDSKFKGQNQQKTLNKNQTLKNNQSHQQLNLRKKYVNFNNGRYGNLDNNPLDKKSVFNTEYQNNFEQPKKNVSLPSLKPLLEVQNQKQQQGDKNSAKNSSIQNQLLQHQQLNQQIKNKQNHRQLSQSQIRIQPQQQQQQQQNNNQVNNNIQNQNKQHEHQIEQVQNTQENEENQENEDQVQENLENQEQQDLNQEELDTQQQFQLQQLYLQQLENQSQAQSQSQIMKSPTKLLAAAKSNITKQQLDAFMQDNEGYFKHLKGECLCLNDKCGQCKCPYKQKSLKPELESHAKSSYANAFRHQKGFAENDSLDVRKHQYSSQMGNINTKSTNHADYVGKTQDMVYVKENRKYRQEHPFLGRSTYGNEFIDFQAANAFVPVKQSNVKTVIDEMTFNGKTSYNQDFVPLKGNVIKPTMNSYMTTTVRSPIPFMAQTTNRQFYKSYGNAKKEKPIIMPSQSKVQVDRDYYDGQFKSSYQNAFQTTKISCPGYTERTIENQKPHKTGYAKIKKIQDIQFQNPSGNQSPY